MREVRPLRSTGITPLPRYYGPVRLPAGAAVALWIPPRRCAVADAPRRVSQDSPPLYRRAPPQSPRVAQCVHRLVTSAPIAGFSTFGRLAATTGVTRPNRVRMRWAHVFALLTLRPVARHPPDRLVSRGQLPFHAEPELHAERAIHMADTSQSARPDGVNLAQPKDTKGTKIFKWTLCPS
jgi:hypothetical protein